MRVRETEVRFSGRQQLGAITRALLITISLATTPNLAQGQQLAGPQQRQSSPSISVCHGSRENQAASQEQGSSDQKAGSSCSLKIPDTFASANTDEATVSNGSFTYTPLSVRCKFRLFVEQTYSPYTFASAGFEATWAAATGRWPHYGGGPQGWAKRFGATLANTESRRFIQTFAMSAILHQDPRYFPSLRRSLISRGLYAVMRVAVARNDNGGSTFNSSEFLGALFTSALQNSYYPRHDRTLGDTVNRFSGALSSDAISCLLREFTPDLKRLFRKHAPKKIQEIEERLPIPADDKP
jgi:hypothetical protein